VVEDNKRESVGDIEETEDYANKTARSLCITGYITIAVGVICGIILAAAVPQGWIAGIVVAMGSFVLCGLLNGVAEIIELLVKIHKKLQ
jgi:hypothetical protein